MAHELQPATPLPVVDRRVLETMAIMASGRAMLTGPVSVQDLFALEDAVLGSSLSIGQSGIDEITRHHFADGVYIREMFIPAGVLLTGAIHRTQHLSVMCRGDISILSVAGLKRFSGETVMVPTVPGVKRVGFAHADTVWIDVHPNPDNERDLQKLWDRFYHNERPE